MTLEELLDLTVEIPNTCHLVRHAENVPIGSSRFRHQYVTDGSINYM